MKKVLIGFLAIVGFLALAAAAAVVGLAMLSLVGRERVPSHALLELNLESGVIESIPEDPLAQLILEGAPTVHDIVESLERAAADRRVEGVVARIGGAGMGLAHIQELRDAVLRFRESGKPTWAFAETFGEFGQGNGGYYLATAFDEILMQPSGDVGLTGLVYESMFVRGLLDKLDVEPDMGQRHEYKNAMNFYTHRAFTDAHREAMQTLVDSQFDQIVRGIAEARSLGEEEVRTLFDAGPHLGAEALDVGLVDGLTYRDELDARIDARVGEEAERMSVRAYLSRAARSARSGTTIALIQGDGAVVRGKSSYSAFDGTSTMGSDTVAQAFRDAVEDERVKAIVFRVNSPGGSYVASDTIWRETVRAREANKPVIVSMGNLAASGGYFVALDAQHIVAEPGTITASIGVLGGKLVTRGFWDKLGVTFDDVKTSEHAAMWSGLSDFGPSRSRFDASLDRIYDDFTQKVAAGRGLELDEVRRIAKGRIWTGEDALALGLVDELGGLPTAFRAAREALDLEPDAPIRIKRFPAPRSVFELFLNRNDGSATTAALVRALAEVQPTLRVLRQMLQADAGRLSMPEVPVPR